MLQVAVGDKQGSAGRLQRTPQNVLNLTEQMITQWDPNIQQFWIGLCRLYGLSLLEAI